ncbi:hypothetical protein [Polyangium jinanense]|uniref:Uncharacterized protein n=1 Tax=Polyangium jinanense TaxID=2829994 RepID=A0A9X4AR72_9BACT|nr:hypothetical protein [Polyangium jinanense]MDC3981803.1 hypothetical protein [Polyangium jinanense]
MRAKHGLTVGSSKPSERSTPRGATLGFWGLGVDVLIGAVVIAGVAVTTLKLQLLRHG